MARELPDLEGDDCEEEDGAVTGDAGEWDDDQDDDDEFEDEADDED